MHTVPPVPAVHHDIGFPFSCTGLLAACVQRAQRAAGNEALNRGVPFRQPLPQLIGKHPD